ncbi:MAG: ABC transporter substrate-binding protein [Chloroflexia bacterium]|nr:ABC transporter substrate-binding protein [Chloroflexia bacterium]
MKLVPRDRRTLGSGVLTSLVAGALLVSAGLAQEATPPADMAAIVGDDGVLTNCVDPSFPPMEFFEDQNATTPVGFDIDLINAIGARWGVEVQHIPTEFTGLLPALEAGRCDVVASGIYLTAERLETFAAQPYYNSSIVLMTNADNDEITSPEDLAGKTVAVQSGTNYVEIMNALNEEVQAAGSPAIDIQLYPDQTDAIQQLIVGRAEATITQDTEAAFRAIAQPGQFKIAYTYDEPQTFGIYHRQDSPKLSAALRDAVEAMRDDGATVMIAETWSLPVEGVEFNEFESDATAEATPAG